MVIETWKERICQDTKHVAICTCLVRGDEGTVEAWLWQATRRGTDPEWGTWTARAARHARATVSDKVSRGVWGRAGRGMPCLATSCGAHASMGERAVRRGVLNVCFGKSAEDIAKSLPTQEYWDM